MTETPRRTQYRHCLAIDFGTTRSGVAYARIDPDPVDEERVQTFLLQKQYPGHGVDNYGDPKTATAILVYLDDHGKFVDFDHNGKRVDHLWGLEAQHLYSRRALYRGGLPGTPRLFTGSELKFALDEDTMIRVAPALNLELDPADLVSMLLGDLVSFAKEHFGFDDIQDPALKIVLTVPPGWAERGYASRLRDAAARAGLIEKVDEDDRLEVIAESEASAIFVQRAEFASAAPRITAGSKFGIVDAGGGTVDICVYEVNADGSLKQVSQSETIEGVGGEFVNRAVEAQLAKLTPESFADMRTDGHDILFDLRQNIDFRKRPFDGSDGMMLPLPMEYLDLAHSYGEAENLTSSFGEGSLLYGRLRLPPESVLEAFSEHVDETVDAVAALIRKHPCESVYLVGGFGESLFLERAMEAGIGVAALYGPSENRAAAVLDGAARYGLSPWMLGSRRSRANYGVGLAFTPEPEDRAAGREVWKNYKGKERVNRFHCLLRKGSVVERGDLQRSSYSQSFPDQMSYTLVLYKSDGDEVPRYTDDLIVLKSVEHEFNAETPFDERSATVFVEFGDTELRWWVETEGKGRVDGGRVAFSASWRPDRPGGFSP